MPHKPALPRPPRHLTAATRRWWAGVVAEVSLEEHHLRVLTKAAEMWDRAEQAREALATHGLTYQDRFGQPSARPEVAIERNAVICFARMLRELNLDIAPPDSRIPYRPGTGRTG